MRGFAIFAGVLALTVPSIAAAAGVARADAQGGVVLASPRMFSAIAVEACRDRQERPFGVVAGGERAARASRLRCLQRVLDQQPLLTRAVLACTERLAQGQSGRYNRQQSLRALTGCSASLLARRPAAR